jgi:uncharacterized protein YndB with AHSA1/START domain
MATRTAGTQQDKPSLRITRRYPATPQRVWRAWTDPQALSRWFGPGEPDSVTLAEMDVREGGRYHIRFHTPDGEEHDVSGVYQEVVEHRRLVFSWAWKSTPERVSRVTIDLRAVDGGTELDFTHDRFFDRAARDNHERGWGGTFKKLDHFLETDHVR